MKYVVNACYGGFGVSEEWLKAHGLNDYNQDELRENAELIKAIENGEDVNGYCAELEVVEIPDNATDWELNEYDGCESIIAVVDGRIEHL